MPVATTPQRLKGMTAVSKDSKVKPLGYIIWFSVPDENVSLRKLRKVWQLAGLDPAPLPRDQRAVNVFKRAVRDLEKTGTFTDQKTGLRTETDVRDLLENADDVIYQVTRVVRDSKEQLVEYPKAIRIWFSKVTGEIGFKPLEGFPRSQALDLASHIQDEFERNQTTVTGAKVRTLVRHYIKEDSDEQSGVVGLSGENLRGKAGGVYFVLARYADQIESLAECLAELYSQGRAYLYAVPLADSKTEREMIRQRHVANTIEEMEAEMQDVSNLLREGRDRGVRSNVASHHWNKLQAFRRRAAQYAEALHDEQESLQDHLEVLNRQLKKLV